jgi:hypothetical protein
MPTADNESIAFIRNMALLWLFIAEEEERKEIEA